MFRELFSRVLTVEPLPDQGAGGGRAHVRSFKSVFIEKVVYLLLVSYTLLMLQPVMPILMDDLAHTFWKQHHILVVHEEHGKFHVHHELVRSSKQSQKNHTSGIYKFDVEHRVQEATAISFTFVCHQPRKIFCNYRPFHSFPFLDSDLRPPRSAA